MAKAILNELLTLVKQQNALQAKLEDKLFKKKQLISLSSQDTEHNLKIMIQLVQHLPEEKQEELKHLITLICQHVEVGMIILFGSYARGDWIEEYEADEIHFKYRSDFDVLIIISESCKAHNQKKLENRLLKEIYDSPLIRTPVSILVHGIGFINCHLKKAQYFFSDIKKEGTVLYDAKLFKLEDSIELDNQQRYELAKDDFEYRLDSAKAFLKNYQFNFLENDLRRAAFMLHQATENLYTGILLVFTRYKPNTHKLDELKKLTNPLDKRLIKIFPSITAEELIWLGAKVQGFMDLMQILCQEKLNSFLAASKTNEKESYVADQKERKA